MPTLRFNFALSLLGVFLLAKGLVLAGRGVPLSLWALPAYLWQDLLVVLAFALVERFARRRWVLWIPYGALVAYVALNVPMTRVLSSPLTWPMARAARGALADSITHYLTAENVALIGLVLATGALAPLLLARAGRARARVRRTPTGEATSGAQPSRHDSLREATAPDAFIGERLGTIRCQVGLTCLGLTAVVALCGLGRIAEARVETAGLHRNPLLALVTSAVPRVVGESADLDWRTSPVGDASPSPAAGDLANLRAAAGGRNVVLIALESTGARYLRPYGAEVDPTPNLTALAQQAILFQNLYAVYPESIKGLFSVLCSRYPAMDTTPELHAVVATPSIAHVLKHAGYRTALFHSGRFAYLGMEEMVQHRGFETLADAGAISGNSYSSFGVDEPATVKHLLGWLDSLPRGEKFFLTYLPIAGHHPYDTPKPGPFPGSDDRSAYFNALHYGDAALGEFLDGLKVRGLFENTLFVIYGDHGEAFGQHEGNYGHTLFIWEENIRVPLLVVAPGLIREPTRVEQVVSLIDIAPTILDLLGLPGPADYQGSSLLEARRRLALFFTDYSLGWLGLRDGPWKFIFEIESGRMKLFDLGTDPAERTDLSDVQQARAAAYREHVKAWCATQRALIRQPEILAAASEQNRVGVLPAQPAMHPIVADRGGLEAHPILSISRGRAFHPRAH
jgi:arylsulfatase A-like enzyme